MNVVLWVVTVLTALPFLGAGITKLTRSKQELFDRGMTFVEDFSPRAIKAIGLLELLGALGLLLPGITGIAPFLVPTAAVGLAIIMGCAITVHMGRGEFSRLGINAVLLALAVFVAIGRLAVWPLGQ